MANGLQTYTVRLPAGVGKRKNVNARGVFMYLKETSFPVKIGLRQQEIGSKSGLIFEQNVRKGEKWYSALEFDRVELENTSAEENDIQIVLGYGDYARELPERVSAADFVRWTRVQIAATGVTQALIAAEGFRKRMVIQNRVASAGAGVNIANTDAELAAGNGEELIPGQSTVHEHKGALVIRGTLNDIVIVREEVYND